MFNILFLFGEPGSVWDDVLQEPIEGGACLDECETLAEALDVADAWRVIAPRQHGAGEVVIVDADGRRVDRGNAVLHPVSRGYSCSK